VVLTSTLNQDPSDNDGPDVELLVSPGSNAVEPGTKLTCLQLPTPDALTRSGDSGGHIQGDISRILRARAYIDLLRFADLPRRLYEGDFGYGSRGFGSLFASHESSFKVLSDFHIMAAHRVLGLTAERASHVRKCPRCNEAPS
jgi:hypothetical protein